MYTRNEHSDSFLPNSNPIKSIYEARNKWSSRNSIHTLLILWGGRLWQWLCFVHEIVDWNHAYVMYTGFGVHFLIWNEPNTIFWVKAFCLLSTEGHGHLSRQLTNSPSFMKYDFASLPPGILSTPVGLHQQATQNSCSSQLKSLKTLMPILKLLNVINNFIWSIAKIMSQNSLHLQVKSFDPPKFVTFYEFMCLVFVCGTFSVLCVVCLHMGVCVACLHHHTCQSEKSSLVQCRSRGMNAVVEAPQTSPLPAEPHHQPYFCF